MALYQGRALRQEAPHRPRRSGGKVKRVLVVLCVIAGGIALAHLPWSALLSQRLLVRDVHIAGLHYLDADHVLARSGLHRGDDLLKVDCDRVRQELLLDPRIREARVSRRWLSAVDVQIEERVPVLLVQHGVPWEVDSSGVLLAPLAAGVVADVPLLTGPHFETWPAGAQVRTRDVTRGLAWVRALSDRELQLAGQVSEVDVSSPDATALTLMSGTRVMSPAWPPGTRTLSALRVVLADLKQRGTLAQEVDLRFDNQVIVRPVEPTGGPPAAPARSS
ncbi:MAG TPA: FtsQ-type POTRA domain-containing protein [Candidatus Saccharimonadaceae bacterium]|jgi:cell division protein FtsQ|nr:FtsQ-type POTRA domain-containing protein [Candidatus Saccharimonadaceae bacterium]